MTANRKGVLAHGVARSRISEAGMTLMEIMIVLAILALVMGFLVGPVVLGRFQKARVDTAKLMAKEFQSAYGMWLADHPDEDCPSSLADLQKYRNKKDTKDPWGNEFEMVCGENAPEDVDFGVFSVGKDKKADTADDIKSWGT